MSIIYVVRDLCRDLLKRGAQINILCDYPEINTKLFGYKSTKVFKSEELFADYQQDHNIRLQQMSPLICAILYRDFNTVKFLLENGANANLCDRVNCTPLMHAVRVVSQISYYQIQYM